MLELKSPSRRWPTRRTSTNHNRTYVELKFGNLTSQLLSNVYHNRTYVELKLRSSRANSLQVGP